MVRRPVLLLARSDFAGVPDDGVSRIWSFDSKVGVFVYSGNLLSIKLWQPQAWWTLI